MPLRRYGHLALNLAIALPFCIVFFLLVLFIKHLVITPTEFKDSRLDGPVLVQPGSVVSITYRITRNEACTIEINRIAEYQEDGPNLKRQFLLQTVIQSFTGDKITRPSGYMVQLDPSMPLGRYDLFSRVRYYCDLLDKFYAHVADMERVQIIVSDQETKR